MSPWAPGAAEPPGTSCGSGQVSPLSLPSLTLLDEGKAQYTTRREQEVIHRKLLRSLLEGERRRGNQRLPFGGSARAASDEEIKGECEDAVNILLLG
ncbi:uncharacterized protein V6R79_004279 [Siganus canaliculatus]